MKAVSFFFLVSEPGFHPKRTRRFPIRTGHFCSRFGAKSQPPLPPPPLWVPWFTGSTYLGFSPSQSWLGQFCYLVKVKVAQSCPALCSPMNYTIHEILQVRILERVAVPWSRGSSQPRNRTQVSNIAGRFFTSWAIREAQLALFSPTWVGGPGWLGHLFLQPLPNLGFFPSPAIHTASSYFSTLFLFHPMVFFFFFFFSILFLIDAGFIPNNLLTCLLKMILVSLNISRL